MTLRPEYSLGHSEYNAFLFAAVGEEKVGLPLTVLTALTRLGFDPWREAARLSDLPRETAARAFAVTIAMLPEGDWKASESEWGVLAAALLFLGLHLLGDNNLEFGRGAGVSTQQ